MAMSPSPQLSPMMGGAHRIDRHLSNSPPLQPQQLSKRDKRRTMLADRLIEITDQFSSNRDHYYRTQLQALQIDMNLIMEANCNEKTPLPDTADEIDALVRENIDRTMKSSLGHEIPVRAGKVYADFVKDINDAMEERDAALATHMRDFSVKMNELDTHHMYGKKLAELEHDALSKTLRDRLINSVMAKKTRLSKDKESIEIETSSALLLHPSQFGFANPSSPGGKRATRHRREFDDFHSYAENNRRKRKAHDSDESPAPHRQRIDNGSSTPSIYTEALMAKQVDSSLYSVDKLFTDKELAMTYTDAALAAHSYILQHPPAAEGPYSPPNGRSDSGSDHGKHVAPTVEHEHEDTHSPPNGATMERQFSHATRSTRGHYTTGFGIDVLPDIHYPGTVEAVQSKVPKLPPINALIVPKNFSQPKHDPYASGGPASLSVEDAQLEYDVIKRATHYNTENGPGSNLDKDMGGRELLQVASETKTFDTSKKREMKVVDGILRLQVPVADPEFGRGSQ